MMAHVDWDHAYATDHFWSEYLFDETAYIPEFIQLTKNSKCNVHCHYLEPLILFYFCNEDLQFVEYSRGSSFWLPWFSNRRIPSLLQVCGHPVDTVKTRMQIREPTKKLRKWKRKIISKHIGIGPVGVDNWFFKGPADLYRGVTGAILGTVPNALLYFAVYESMLSSIPNHIKEFWISSLSLLGLSLVSQVSPSQWSNIALTWGVLTSWWPLVDF